MSFQGLLGPSFLWPKRTADSIDTVNIRGIIAECFVFAHSQIDARIQMLDVEVRDFGD
ncbi:MAG: hypothetical protein AAF194_03595 [Pseudomonadota bacterium]